MPRPKSGYVNSAGQPIPGTNDISRRFQDSGGLIQWAYGQGKKGLPLYDRSAIDIGSVVHHMADLDLRGRPDREIEQHAHEWLAAPEHLQKAWSAFRAFREWRQQCHVRAIASEVSLVSETHQYGGTPDHIAMFGNAGLGLIDLKTASKPKVYSNHLVTMAGHANLWQEAHPTQPLTAGFHLILLPKDGGTFQHHAYADLSAYWEMFKLYREAYRLDQDCGSASAITAAESDPMAFAKATPEEIALAAMLKASARVKKTPKPRVRVKASSEPCSHATMAEMLRAYGHVKEAVA